MAFGLVAVPAISHSAPTRIKTTRRDTWNPDFAHVSPGGRVVWANPARFDRTHDVTAYGGNWRKRVTLAPGERTSKRFRRVGVYKFRCRVHSHLADRQCHGMCGVVHVMR